MKKYDTPYGKKTAGLLMLAMDAYVREEKAVELIKELVETITHEGLENCDLIDRANKWLEKRKQSIAETESKNH